MSQSEYQWEFSCPCCNEKKMPCHNGLCEDCAYPIDSVARAIRELRKKLQHVRSAMICSIIGHIYTPVLQTEGMRLTEINGRTYIGSFFKDVRCVRCGYEKPAEVDMTGKYYLTNKTE